MGNPRYGGPGKSAIPRCAGFTGDAGWGRMSVVEHLESLLTEQWPALEQILCRFVLDPNVQSLYMFLMEGVLRGVGDMGSGHRKTKKTDSRKIEKGKVQHKSGTEDSSDGKNGPAKNDSENNYKNGAENEHNNGKSGSQNDLNSCENESKKCNNDPSKNPASQSRGSQRLEATECGENPFLDSSNSGDNSDSPIFNYNVSNSDPNSDPNVDYNNFDTNCDPADDNDIDYDGLNVLSMTWLTILVTNVLRWFEYLLEEEHLKKLEQFEQLLDENEKEGKAVSELDRYYFLILIGINDIDQILILVVGTVGISFQRWLCV